MKVCLLLTVFLLLPLTAEAGLPRVAISIPPGQNVAEGLSTAARFDIPNKLIVLPPLVFNIGGDFTLGANPAGSWKEQEQSLHSVPEGVEVWVHVVVEGDSLTGKESEQEITKRVDAFVRSLPVSAAALHGFIVEIKESMPAPDLFAFGLVRLTLDAKAANANLRVALVFPPGFIGSHGDLVRRVASYSDLIGVTYGKSWQADAAWVAAHALNKPIILKSDIEGSTTPSPFLTARSLRPRWKLSGRSRWTRRLLQSYTRLPVF